MEIKDFRMNTLTVKIGESLMIGGESPIVVQTMCNTHTSDVEASVLQCVRLYEAGAQMIRLTVPSLAQVVPTELPPRTTLPQQ